MSGPTPFMMQQNFTEGSVAQTNYVAEKEKATARMHQNQDAMNMNRLLGQPIGAFQAPDAAIMQNLLPLQIKMEEQKQMQKVAEEYQKTYVKQFQDRYGFQEDQLKDIRGDFDKITGHILELLPTGDMKTMYEKYIKSYPNLFFSIIPPEALQARLAAKCESDNRTLRTKVADMSKCVSTLVKNLSDLQVAAGIPPIVNLMFESMPDPLTAITDPMYSSYNQSISVYHKLSTHFTDTKDSLILQKLHTNPAVLLKDLLKADEPVYKYDDDGNETEIIVTVEEMKKLLGVVEGMRTQSGCQPHGDEWNHTGAEPAMNAAMCLAENERIQPGNPRHSQGRTALYQAQRTQDGGAVWVQKGQVPNVAQPSFVANSPYQGNPQPQAPQAPFGFPQGYQQGYPQGYPMQAPTPRKVSKKSSKKVSKKSKKGSK